jgi:hypothetical protein
MSRPQKIHAPLPFTFNEVLMAVASGSGVSKPTPQKPIQKSSKEKSVRKKSK